MPDQNAGPRWFFANLVEVKLTQGAGGGKLSVVELSGPPGDMPPLHLHRGDDEAFYVLEGEMSFFIGTDRPSRRAAGSLAFGPKAFRTPIGSSRAGRRAGWPSARRVTSPNSSLRRAGPPSLPPCRRRRHLRANRR